MTPREVETWRQEAAARAAAMAKWADGSQLITEEDVPSFTGQELRALADAGRLTHLGIGPDKRLRR